MNKSKRKRLERRGWKVGSASEFLGLSAEESRFIELKLALSRRLRGRREALKLTQIDLAQRLQSSQSRIAKMEAGDPSVSLDLLIRSLFALGTTKRDLARVIAASKPPRGGACEGCLRRPAQAPRVLNNMARARKTNLDGKSQ